MVKVNKILVIGGTGFIGYHVIKEALKRRWKVTSISTSKPKKLRRHPKVDYKIANLENIKSLFKAIKGSYDYVVNAGGYGKNPDFNKDGVKLFKTHYQGTINLVEILSNKKIKKFVQIGSSAEYGYMKSPLKEHKHCDPKTPYGIAKYLSTQFLLNMHSVKRFPSIILRFFLVYGPKQDQNRILPIVIENCLRDKKFPTTKGDQYCDFCHINDAIKAIFKSLLLKSINGEIINIGSGKPIQIKKVIKLVKNLIGKGKPQIGKLQYKIGTNKKLYPSIIKAKKKINWKPSITFEKGLKETITYFYER